MMDTLKIIQISVSSSDVNTEIIFRLLRIILKINPRKFVSTRIFSGLTFFQSQIIATKNQVIQAS